MNAFLIKIQKAFSLSLDPLDLLISIGVSFAFHSFPRSPRPSLGGLVTASESGRCVPALRKWFIHAAFSLPSVQCHAGLGGETSFPGLLTPVTSCITLRKSLILSWLQSLSLKEPGDYPKASCSLHVLLLSVCLCFSSPVRLSAHKRQGFHLTFGTFHNI